MVMPKVACVATVDRVSAILDAAGAPSTMTVWAMIETPTAIFDVRAIVCVLAGLPLGLGWAWAFFEKEKRAFQDLAAGTWVIRVR